MATQYVAQNHDIKRAAEIIMETLPICSERKIAYSTFTIVDMDHIGHTRIVEYDNPSFILIREGQPIDVIKSTFEFNSPTLGQVALKYAEFQSFPEDRIIFFSDGVIQAGMGTERFPMGWGDKNATLFVKSLIQENNGISANELAEKVVTEAIYNNGYHVYDDTTCGVIYVRKPRNLLIFTGPPFDKANDSSLKEIYSQFQGKKVICGGTTANILARELNQTIRMIIDTTSFNIPPYSEMEGFDLITEGTITLSHVARRLQDEIKPSSKKDSVQILIDLFTNSDIIHFVIGTRINEAHQDPTLPESLDIRRNIIKEIARLLETRLLKKVSLQYI